MFTYYIIIFAIRSTANAELVNLVDEILKGDGMWILAAAGTTGRQPPWESCVEVNITDTGQKSDCAILYSNHTFNKVRIISYVGYNEANKLEIRSKGPTHQFMIKHKQSSHTTPLAFKNEFDYDAALNQAICWSGRTERPLEWRYLITPITKNIPVDAFFLIGVRERLQAPEYELAIFTKGKLDQTYLKDIIDKQNFINQFFFMEMCMVYRSINYGNWFPPYCLPKLYMKCALGYRIWDVTHKYNIMGESDDEVKFINNGKRLNKLQDLLPQYFYQTTETILVPHQK